MFDLYIGPQAELLKRLAEPQWKGKARHSGGSTTHIQDAVNDPHPIYSTQSWAVKAMLLIIIEVEPR